MYSYLIIQIITINKIITEQEFILNTIVSVLVVGDHYYHNTVVCIGLTNSSQSVHHDKHWRGSGKEFVLQVDERKRTLP